MSDQSPSRPVVLVVEDYQEIRELVAEVLRRSGFYPLCAEHGVAAIELLASRQDIALILLDLNMPVLNGYMFLELKALIAEWRHLPVIIFSADENIEFLRDKSDVVDVLSKNIPLGELAESIGRTLAFKPETGLILPPHS